MYDETKSFFNKISQSKTIIPSISIYLHKTLPWIMKPNLFSIKTIQIKLLFHPHLYAATNVSYMLATNSTSKMYTKQFSPLIFFAFAYLSWLYYVQNNYSLHFFYFHICTDIEISKKTSGKINDVVGFILLSHTCTFCIYKTTLTTTFSHCHLSLLVS